MRAYHRADDIIHDLFDAVHSLHLRSQRRGYLRRCAVTDTHPQLPSAASRAAASTCPAIASTASSTVVAEPTTFIPPPSSHHWYARRPAPPQPRGARLASRRSSALTTNVFPTLRCTRHQPRRLSAAVLPATSASIASQTHSPSANEACPVSITVTGTGDDCDASRRRLHGARDVGADMNRYDLLGARFRRLLYSSMNRPDGRLRCRDRFRRPRPARKTRPPLCLAPPGTRAPSISTLNGATSSPYRSMSDSSASTRHESMTTAVLPITRAARCRSSSRLPRLLSPVEPLRASSPCTARSTLRTVCPRSNSVPRVLQRTVLERLHPSLDLVRLADHHRAHEIGLHSPREAEPLFRCDDRPRHRVVEDRHRQRRHARNSGRRSGRAVGVNSATTRPRSRIEEEPLPHAAAVVRVADEAAGIEPERVR